MDFEHRSISDDEQWDIAARYVGLLKRIPEFVTVSCRGIRNAIALFEDRGGSDLESAVIDLTKRLFSSSPTYQTVLRSAVSELYPAEAEEAAKGPISDLLRLLSPMEVMAIVAIVYLSKTTVRGCESKEATALNLKMRTHLAIGRLVGHNVQRIGPGLGLLLAGLRCAGFNLLVTYDARHLKTYRRLLAKSGELFDLAHEEKTFGTTHLHVASHLCQKIGAGASTAQAFLGLYAGLSKCTPEVQLQAQTLRAVEELHLKRSLTSNRTFVQLASLSDKQIANITSRAGAIAENPDSFSWINRQKVEPAATSLEEASEED